MKKINLEGFTIIWLIISIILALALLIITLALLGVIHFNTNPSSQSGTREEQLIGGDTDEGGCLIAAGYSWCAAKNKCLRIWEEPCIEPSLQTKIENYFQNNISELSPGQEVLGGKFFITNFEFTSDNRVVIDYEDGHNTYSAAAIFGIENDEIIIYKFSLLSVNGSTPENAGNSNPAIVELTNLFAKKYNLDPSNIIISINIDRGQFLRGSVKFSLDENAPGGYFLARLKNGQYEIAVDGNGQIDCQLVSDFPTDMISDCVE